MRTELRSEIHVTSFGLRHVLTVEWEDVDLIPLDLDGFDLALLRACDESHSMADKVLMVEMLVRKYERQQARWAQRRRGDELGENNGRSNRY